MAIELEPYVGPRPFERGEEALFFGRDREASEVLSLVIAHSMLLLYAPSGAGKTSLLNAKLIPLLEGEEFEVLPLARVRGLIPEDIGPEEIPNLYAFNTLMGWAEDEADTRQLVQMYIADFLKQRERPIDEEGLPSPRVVIFDQFEELFAFYPERWRDREGFFEQVRDALEGDPLLRVVFVLREDYLAQLDPYAPLLPEKLRTRFRLERLREGAALAAVTSPLKDTERSFAEGVAEQLVEELLKIRVTTAAGETVEVTGEFVEPVQLQVVCQSLWQDLPPDVTVITRDHLQAFGDVNQALSGFYERSIERAVQGTGVKERDLRSWFEYTLITPAGTRGTVYRGREETDGIANAAVDVLENLHLIRGEWRAGARWYELTHDRFIEPIKESDKTWEKNKEEERAKKRQTVLAALGVVVVTLLVIAFATAQAIIQNQAEQARFATSRQLAAQAPDYLDDQLDLALLLSLQACRFNNSLEARSSLLTGLEYSPYLTTFLHGHRASVYGVAFSPDGKTLASGSKDSTIILWDVAAGQPISKTLTAYTEEVWSVAFGPDGQTLASGSKNGTVILWDVVSGQLIGQSLTGHTKAVRSVAFSPDGRTLASGSYDATIILWDIATGQPIGKPLTGHTDWVYSVAFSPDGQTLASGGASRTIILWDVATGQPIGQPLIGHADAVLSVAFSPGGQMLASGSNDQTIILWDVATGQPIGQPLTGHADAVLSVAFSPGGQMLASGSNDQTIILWDTAARQRLGRPLTRHMAPVRSVAFSPDSQTLASGGIDQTIILWDVATGQPIGQPLTGHMDAVYSVAFSPDGRTLASGSRDNTIILWDIATGQPIGKPLTGHTDWVYSVAFSPDGQTLASGSKDSTIILWDVAVGQPIGKPLTGHMDTVRSVAFSPDGQTLASGSEANTIILWDVAAGQPLGQPLAGHKDAVLSVAFSPGGQILASGGYRTIILWNATTGQQLGQISTGHTDWILSLAFSPDGQILASASEDDTITLWNVGARQSLGQPLTDHTDAVLSVAFSPDGKTLASGSNDQTIILWDVSFESWQDRACRIANRNLTEAEWNRFIGPDIPYECTCPELPTGEGAPSAASPELPTIASPTSTPALITPMPVPPTATAVSPEATSSPTMLTPVPPAATPTATNTPTPTNTPTLTSTPTCTPTPIPPVNTPTVTPTPTSELLPPPTPFAPENGQCFLGEPVTFRWQWNRPRTPDEVFSVRVRREGDTKLCHHDKAEGLEYKGSLSYCTAGTHYWSVVLVRDLRPWLPEEDIDRWQDLSEPSEERWFYYVPSEEPWTWPTPPGEEEEGSDWDK